MRKVQIILVLIFGLISVWLEFRNIKQDTIFGVDMLFDGVPLVILFVLTSIYIFKNTIQYRQTKKYLSFVPTLTGFVFITLIFGHKHHRSSLNNSPTLFTATNENLGNDGGFIFDFKTNNHLKGEKRDHWSVTYYWGTYKRQGDSLLLDIPLDFKMERRAILQDSILRFLDDTIKFEVIQQ